MWTPKRILLLAGSFLFFALGFLGYGFSNVGRIDGLPPLPEAYRPGGDITVPKVEEVGPTKLELRLESAFGKDCAEMHRAIRLDIRSRNMLLSSEHFNVLPDGRVSLTPLSVALFGKEPPANSKDPRAQEI